MFLDLHTHSVSSDDSRATVDQYVKWVGVLRGRGYRIDGFVLTEHRKFDFDKDYSRLAAENDVLVLKGSELDTTCGHFLVYGVSEELTRLVDFADVPVDALQLMRHVRDCGAIAVPAHPGRFGIGLYEFLDNGSVISGIEVVEGLNGGNRPGEQERATQLIETYGYRSTGGSDAHLVSSIGTCMTRFERPIAGEEDLVRELRSGAFGAVRIEETAAG